MDKHAAAHLRRSSVYDPLGLLALILLAHAADTGTTILGLMSGHVETSLVSAAAVAGLGVLGLVAVKIAVILGSWVVVLSAYRLGLPRLMRWTLAVSAMMTGLVPAALNGLVLARAVA